MNNTLRPMPALMATFLVLVSVAMLSRIPIGKPSQDGLLRLSWRTNEGKLEVCRSYTEAELAQIPIHMRKEKLCVSHMIPYQLRILIDGQPLVDRSIAPGGARSDHPLIVQEEFRLAPGEHDLEVTFIPIKEPALLHDEALTTDQVSRIHESLSGFPRYQLTRKIRNKAGAIIFVDLDEKKKEFSVFEG